MSGSIAFVTEPPNTVQPSVRRLLLLSLPLIFLASSGSIAFFFNSLFLAHCSVEDLQAQSIGNALVALFQSACIRMGSDVQIFISQAYSSQNCRQIGIYLWQMIWLAILSLLLTLPVSYVISNYYFDSSPIQQLAKEYFRLFMFGNFLFPLSAALSSFFSGRGKLKLLYIGNAFLIVLHLALASMIIPLIGVKGAAYSQLLSQALYCCVLLTIILRKNNRLLFGTNQWKISKGAMIATFRVGAFNGFSAALMSLSWTVIVKFVATKGSDFLTVMAFGGSCAKLFSFLNLGLGQAISIEASYLIGRKQYKSVGSLIRTSAVVMFLILLLLFLPLVVFPEKLLSFFFSDFPDKFSPELAMMLKFSCRTLWFYELVGGVDRLMRGLLTATGDTVYMFKVYTIFLSIGTILPFYLTIEIFSLLPSAFWVIMTLTIFARNYPLFLKYRKGAWKENNRILVS